jgi:hypothetical protein
MARSQIGLLGFVSSVEKICRKGAEQRAAPRHVTDGTDRLRDLKKGLTGFRRIPRLCALITNTEPRPTAGSRREGITQIKNDPRRWSPGLVARAGPMGLGEGSRAGPARKALNVNFQQVVHSAQIVNANVATTKRFAEGRMDTHKNARL